VLECIDETLQIDFRANKPSDVISTLVSIYDSKDLFVKELQVLLAQRLLTIKDDGMEKVEKEVG
jgi:anaphase-promoting complex subunit 2